MGITIFFIIFIPSVWTALNQSLSLWVEDDVIRDEQLDNGTTSKAPKWPNGVVPYDIGPGLESIHGIIRDVATEFSHKTCIRFVPKQPSDEHYVQFIRSDSLCGRATACKASGVQSIWIGKDCFNYETIVHELGHAICMSHEHQRPDRDSYITVKCDHKQYAKNDDEYSKLGLMYDYMSVMHPHNCNGTCLVPSPKFSNATVCGGKELSVLDAEKINSLYDCGDCHGYRFRPGDWNQSVFVASMDEHGTELGVCRAYTNGDIMLGNLKLLNREAGCRVPYRGDENYVKPFEVMTQVDNKHFGWHSMRSGDTVPYHTIPGGWNKDGEPQFIGRCTTIYENKTVVIPGYIYHGRMYYALWFKGLECENFEVLRYSP